MLSRYYLSSLYCKLNKFIFSTSHIIQNFQVKLSEVFLIREPLLKKNHLDLGLCLTPWRWHDRSSSKCSLWRLYDRSLTEAAPNASFERLYDRSLTVAAPNAPIEGYIIEVNSSSSKCSLWRLYYRTLTLTVAAPVIWSCLRKKNQVGPILKH